MGVVKPKAGSGDIGRPSAERRGEAVDWQAGGTRGCAGVVTHPRITAPVALLLLPWWHPQAGVPKLSLSEVWLLGCRAGKHHSSPAYALSPLWGK